MSRLRVEVWDLANANPITPIVPALDIAPQKVRNGVGWLRFSVPADWDRTGLLDPSADPPTAGTARVYFDEALVGSFWIHSEKVRIADEGDDHVVDLAGPEISDYLGFGRVYPRDWPANPTLAPAWSWGSLTSAVRNGSFEASSLLIENGDAETADTSGWSKSGSVSTFDTISGDVFEGTRAFRVTPTKKHGGMRQTFETVPGGLYVVKARLKDPATTGRRFTIASNLSGTVVEGHRVVSDGEVLGMLDRVAYDPYPQGSSDGTYQELEISAYAGADQDSAYVTIKYDDHVVGDGGATTFYVDAVEVLGPGGISPWEVIQGTAYADGVTIEASPFDGSLVLSVTALDNNVQQEIDVIPGATYTASARVAGDGFTDITFAVYGDDGTPFGTSLVLLTSTPGGTWTELTAEFTVPAGITKATVYLTSIEGLGG